jgi:hypothetical protein
VGCTLIRGTLLLFCSLLSAAVPADRLDDSLSPQQQINLQLDWKTSSIDPDKLDQHEIHRVIAQAKNVDTRLATSKYLGMEVRIYLALPILVRGLSNPQGMNFSWTTNGLFLDGQLTPGNRQLIFEGKVTSPVMIDNFHFTFELDARDLTQTLRLEPVYDLEIITP